MNRVICLLVVLIFTQIAQLCLLPALVPAFLRPDVGLLVGMLVISFGTRELGLVCLFSAGVAADLFGAGRFGLLPLCYLLAAGLVVSLAQREMTRGDRLSTLVCALVGTGVAHLLYLVAGRFCGMDRTFGAGMLTIFTLLLAAAVWGYPLMYICGSILRWTATLSPVVRQRWAAEARLSSARRGATRG